MNYSMNRPDYTKLRGPQFTEKHFKFHYPEFLEYINAKYPNITNFQERLYWEANNLTEFPTCYCGAPVVFEGFGKGYRKYCSRKCMNSDPLKKEAVKQTNIRRYGGVAPAASQAVKQKSKETCIRHYGVENPLQNKSIKEKVFGTITKRYGGIGTASPILAEKQKQTNLNRYGVEHSHQRPEVLNKVKKMIMDRYGVSNPCLLGMDRLKEKKLKQSQERYPDIIDVVDDQWLCECPHLDCDKCEEKTYMTPRNVHRDRTRQHNELCTKLLPVGDASRTSTQELIIRSWLDEWGITYITNDRSVIPPKELDIYIPTLKIAIECNGCYWHSDMEKPRDYHIKKFIECRDKEIQLIQIWEDWMINKPEVVKSLLQAKLGICNTTYYARKCTIQEIDYQTATNFLELNHIQGKCSSNYRIGLFFEGLLVAVMCFNKRSALSGSKQINDSEAELIRFCNLRGTRVIGGAGKLLKHYIKTFNPAIVTSYSANDISNGQLYKSLGFVPNSKISESYWYIEPITFRRQHRSIYTRSGIVRKWPEYDINDKSWTERMVMDSKGYMRIYDAGTTKWVLNIKQ